MWLMLLTEHLIYLKNELLILFISTLVAYVSLKVAKHKFPYKFSFSFGIFCYFLSNIALILMGNSISMNGLFLIIVMLIYNIFVPFLSVRKAYYTTD